MTKIKYFRVITQTTGFKYLIEMANQGDHFWNYLYQGDYKDAIIEKISDYVIENDIDYRLINDSSTSNFILDVEKEIIKKRKIIKENSVKTIDFKVIYHRNKYVVIEETSSLPLGEGDVLWEADFCIAKEIKARNIKHYRVFREFQNENRYEIRFDPEFVINMYEKDVKIDEDDSDYDDYYDDEEITKDLMLDEVISSQHQEIERLTEIIKDLVTTNLKLVEMLASKK